MSVARFVIVDQSLRDFSGHHYEYDVAVLEAASAHGFDTVLATHRDFASTNVHATPVIRAFSSATDEARRSGVRNAARRVLAVVPPAVRGPALRLASRFERRPEATRIADEFGATVARLIENERLSEADHVLVHTVVAGELMGLASALKGRTSLPRLHVVLRYEEASPLVSEAAAVIAQDRLLARSLRLWTDTHALADHYRALGLSGMGVLPIPHCLPVQACRRSPATSPLVLSFLGGARRDKGFDLLPDLVENLRDEFLSTGRVRFLVQADYCLSVEEPLIAAAVRRLRAFPTSWVAVVDGPLHMKHFHQALCESDILLLPYRQDAYRFRSSGLLVLAAAAGVPTVVPESTWLAAEAPCGAHVTFGRHRSFLEATRLAVERHVELAAVAATAAPTVRARHDAGRLVAALTDASAETSETFGHAIT